MVGEIAANAPAWTVWLTAVVGPMLVAGIAGIPAVFAARRAKGAAESAQTVANTHSATAPDMVAAVLRLEGKLDLVRADVREVVEAQAKHAAQHDIFAPLREASKN